jgi:hypothetical protein
LQARDANSVVSVPMVDCVVRKRVVRIARGGQPDRVLHVVPIAARRARCGAVLGALLTERPLWRGGSVLVWSAHAGGSPSNGERVAEHAVPADRCAHELWPVAVAT